MLRAQLVAHPRSTCGAVRAIEVAVSRHSSGSLALTFVLDGDLERLTVPAWKTRERGERLWEHTCFEVFIRQPGRDAYHELNFAPSGAWAAYAFERYREGAPLAGPSLDPQIAVRRGEGRLELEAAVRFERLSPDYVDGPLALALSAVVEDAQAALSYWALAHPPGKPDFHHPDSFAISLSARCPG